jgi:hypothetical protein
MMHEDGQNRCDLSFMNSLYALKSRKGIKRTWLPTLRGGRGEKKF